MTNNVAACSHLGAAGPCVPRIADDLCIWCERPLVTQSNAITFGRAIAYAAALIVLARRDLLTAMLPHTDGYGEWMLVAKDALMECGCGDRMSFQLATSALRAYRQARFDGTCR